jgi:hypothetical protein
MKRTGTADERLQRTLTQCESVTTALNQLRTTLAQRLRVLQHGGAPF